MACKKVCEHACVYDLGWFHSYKRRCKGGGVSWGKRLFDINFFEFIHVKEKYAFFHNFFFPLGFPGSAYWTEGEQEYFKKTGRGGGGGGGGGGDKSAVCLQNWECKHTRKKKVQLEVTDTDHKSWLFTKVKKIKVGMSDTDHGTEETKEHQKCSQMATYCLDSCTYI